MTADQSRHLVARTQHGDPDAAADIYRRYRPFIHDYIARRVRPDTVDDLTHDTFTRAYTNIHRWQWQGVDIRAWLTTIARNLIHDHRKSRYVQRVWLAGGDLNSSGDPDAGWAFDNAYGNGWFTDTHPDADLEAAAITRRRDAALRNAIRVHLTPDQRAVLAYRFWDDLTVAETAARMGRDESAVKSLTYRAIQALGRKVGEPL